jgi:hypothetical protein
MRDAASIRIFAAAACGLALGFSLGCEPERAPASVQAAAKMSASLKLDREVYVHEPQSAALMKAQLILHNPGPGSVPLTFPSSQRYDLEVRNGRGEVLVRWSEDRAFAMVLGEEEIPPGDRVYSIELRLATGKGAPLPPGRYVARAWITCTGPDEYSASAPFEIRASQ